MGDEELFRRLEKLEEEEDEAETESSLFESENQAKVKQISTSSAGSSLAVTKDKNQAGQKPKKRVSWKDDSPNPMPLHKSQSGLSRQNFEILVRAHQEYLIA